MPESEQIMKNTGVTEEHRVEEELQRDSVQNLNDISLPFTVEGVTLISPGTWNRKKYQETEIRQAYERTDWSDPDVVSLFNEHDDEDSRDWIGEVKNPRMEGQELVADIDVVTAEEARKLAYGARFGISPKVTGRDARDVMRDFSYDNFSLVLDPAVKTTYINSEQQETDGDAEDSRDVKNVTVKSTMSEDKDSKELSDDEIEQIEDLAQTVENADVEDLAEIISPFVAMEPDTLQPHLEEAMSDQDVDEEDATIDVEDVATQAAEMVREEMDDEDADDSEADEAEESLSVDEVADKVADRLEDELSADEEEEEEMNDEEVDEDDEAEEEMSVEDVVSEVKDEIKAELDSVKEELSSDEEDTEKTPNPGSQATGRDSQELEDQVKDLDADELDKGMARHMLRTQSSSLR